MKKKITIFLFLVFFILPPAIAIFFWNDLDPDWLPFPFELSFLGFMLELGRDFKDFNYLRDAIYSYVEHVDITFDNDLLDGGLT